MPISNLKNYSCLPCNRLNPNQVLESARELAEQALRKKFAKAALKKASDAQLQGIFPELSLRTEINGKTY